MALAQIYDFNSADDLGAPHWIIEDPAPLDWVEVPLEGSDAPCDNPIVRADGALYSGAATAGDGEVSREALLLEPTASHRRPLWLPR